MKSHFRDILAVDTLLQAAARSYAPGELAYLVLTGSLRASVRDRIAFAAQQAPETAAEGWVVGRDQLDDVTIHRSERVAAAVLEVESIYAFEAVLTPKQADVWAVVQTDIVKCGGRSMSAAADAYCVITMTHVLARIPDRLFANVPRAADINRGHSTFYRLDDLVGAAKTFMCDAFEDRGARIADVPVAAGEAFGIPVEVYWFVLELGRAT